MPTCGEVLANALWDLGVRRVFGLPGGENIHVLEALRNRGLEFWLVRNESSAAYAAAACWRLTGVPQACLTTLGPGATHAMAGVGHLWLDRAPVVVITARTAEMAGPMHTHQVLDLTGLMAPVTKKSFVVTPATAGQLPDVLSLLEDGRPGPVHVQISNEMAAQEAQPGYAAEPAPATGRSVASCDRALQEAQDVLAQARRPVIVAGLGVREERAAAAMVHLAETLGAVVIVTPKAKGAIPDAHPLAGGVIGLTRTDPVYDLLEASDAVVAVGFDVVELVKPWDIPHPLIWLASWPNQDPVLPAAAELVGCLTAMLNRLATGVTRASGWRDYDLAGFRRRHTTQPPVQCRLGTVSPQHVLQALRQHADEDAVLTVDVGSHKIYFSLDWPTRYPGSFLLSNGLSCMGYGLVSALGAGIVDPRRQTICVTGDGGLAMCAGELGLLRELGSNTKIIVMHDQALDLIRAAQLKAGKPPTGTEYAARTDHVKLAEAFALPAVAVHSATDLHASLRDAMASQEPCLVEIAIDPASYPTAAPPA